MDEDRMTEAGDGGSAAECALYGLSDAETRHQTARDWLGVVRMQNDDFFTLPKVRSECTSHGSDDNRKDR